MATAISVKNLGKQYVIGAAQTKFRYNMLRDVIVDTINAPVKLVKALVGKSDHRVKKNFVWALEDVSFDLEEGKVLGIVGRNGAGKSTLLKILSRVTPPTTGEVRLRGRVGSLLEVGTGFHPELTGRENIFLNGAILGMRRREIAARFDAIVAFAEVDRFLDRLDHPEKHWKFSASDVAERAFWDDYMDAYEDALEATSTDEAPWYVVPADSKWAMRAVVSDVLTSTIRSNSSMGNSSTGWRMLMPALLTQMSILPKRPSTSSTSASTAAGTVTSAARPIAVRE